MDLLIATTNPGKLREIRGILAGVPIAIRTLSDFPVIVEPEETGATFAENARLKATYYSQATGLPATSIWNRTRLPSHRGRVTDGSLLTMFMGNPFRACFGEYTCCIRHSRRSLGPASGKNIAN